MLGFILEKAREDEILDSWITNINQVVSQELNLMSEEECKNQKALLQEHLVTNDLPAILKIKPLSFLYLLRWSLTRLSNNNWLAKIRAFVRAIKVRVFWKKLNSIDFGPIAYKLVSNGWTQQRTKKAIATYIAFMLLVYLYPNRQIVPTKEIDAVWHHHILDTSKYSQDCQLLFDRFLHHFPYLGVRGETDKQNLDIAFARTKALFQEHFGEDILIENDSQKANSESFDIAIEDVEVGYSSSLGFILA